MKSLNLIIEREVGLDTYGTKQRLKMTGASMEIHCHGGTKPQLPLCVPFPDLIYQKRLTRYP